MLPTESLLEVFMWLKRVDISCAVLASELFRNIAVKNNSRLALHPVEALTLSDDDGSDLAKWQLSVWYAEQTYDASADWEEADHAEEFGFDEGFLRFTLVLQICSVKSCEITASGEASLSPFQWKSFLDATKSSNVVGVDLFGIGLQQLRADEFSELTCVPGLRELLIDGCSLLSAFVDARFLRACGEYAITTLHVPRGPVDGTHYAIDDQGLLDFCFKRRAGTPSPTELQVALYYPTISADFVARFSQAYSLNPFHGFVDLHFGHYHRRSSWGRRRLEKRAVPELHVSVDEDLVSFQGR